MAELTDDKRLILKFLRDYPGLMRAHPLIDHETGADLLNDGLIEVVSVPGDLDSVAISEAGRAALTDTSQGEPHA